MIKRVKMKKKKIPNCLSNQFQKKKSFIRNGNKIIRLQKIKIFKKLKPYKKELKN